MMVMKVYHVGYSEGGAEERVNALMSDPMMLLIDTRKKPSSWRVEWCKDDTVVGDCVIPGLRTQWGERYHPAGHVLGNRNYWLKGAPIDIVNLPLGIRGLLYYLKRGYSLILLCECSVVEDCHRFVILKALKLAMPEVQIYQADGMPELLIA